MQKLRLKICGLRQKENIEQVLELQPDYIGFIFYKKSKRYVEKFVDNFKLSTNSNALKTGVFVNASFDELQKTIKNYQLKAIQLHGEETPELCQKIKATGVEVIKVFSVDDDFYFEKTKPYEVHCDLFLFDTKGKLPGGNGYTFNWKILENYKGDTPFFLSGGIGLDSVESLKNFRHPKLYGIDVNSRFEIEPALKDVEKLRKFTHQIHSETLRNNHTEKN